MDALTAAWRYGDDSVPEVGVTFAGTFVRHPLARGRPGGAQASKGDGPLLHEQTAARTSVWPPLAELSRRTAEPGSKTIRASFILICSTNTPPCLLLTISACVAFTSGRLSCFLTTAHSDADVEATVAAFADSLTEMSGSASLRPRPPAPSLPTRA
jgi:hypothetical protein